MARTLLAVVAAVVVTGLITPQDLAELAEEQAGEIAIARGGVLVVPPTMVVVVAELEQTIMVVKSHLAAETADLA
jgi:hypothetical protein